MSAAERAFCRWFEEFDGKVDHPLYREEAEVVWDAAWKARGEADIKSLPDPALAQYGDETQRVRGWNHCLSTCDERIQSLDTPDEPKGT